ncbi:Ig-like domain-containing protein [Sphingomicrobium sp. XHP0239]|uniref:beta strand repeat-containing protein n=1 Tax=Sphingomicrobium maritimum TaxID=3133972 RepID=UPI0031CCB658
MARVILTEEGEDIIVGGDDIVVVGTTSGGEEITIVSGNVVLNASFAAGGDTINLPGDAEDYVVRSEGAQIIFTNTVTGDTIQLPASGNANTITFSGGDDARELVFDSVDGRFELDGQPITNQDTAVRPDGFVETFAPNANDDTFSVNEDAVLSGDVGANDTDVDTDADDLTFELVDGTDVAGLTFNDDGTFTLDTSDAAYAELDPGETATVTFSYTVTDEAGNSDIATATVTVNGQDSDPVATAATDEGDEDTTISGTLADDATDPEGQPLTFTLVGAAPAGFTLNPNGTYTLDASNAAYQPLNDGESQDVVVTYQVTDPAGNTDTNTLTITVNGTSIGTTTQLTEGVDRISGTQDDDIYIARNNQLGAGDRIDDPNGGDNDELRLFVDSQASGGGIFGTGDIEYGAFVLDQVENLFVTNDSGETVTIDLSSSVGLEAVITQNSSDDVEFNQLTNLVDIVVDNVTDSANVLVDFQDSVLAGNTTVNLTVDDANPGTITIGGLNGDSSAGVETINLNVEGDSEIDGLDSDITTLNVFGEGDLFLGNLPGTLQVLDASAHVGSTVVSIDDLSDTPTVILSGDDGDTVVTDDDDIDDEDFTDFEGVTVLSATDGSSVVLGEEALEAGIEVVNLGLDSSDSTDLDATDFDGSLTVNVDGGNNNVDLGDSDDVVNVDGLFSSDVLNAGEGSDTLNIFDFANYSTFQFSGFELVTLSGDGAFHLDLNDGNAPSEGGVLEIDATAVDADADEVSIHAGSQDYNVLIRGSEGDDSLWSDQGIGGDVIYGNGGDDDIDVGGEAGLADIAYGGDGNDSIDTYGGDNDLYGEAGNDTFTFVATDGGDNRVFGGAGNDALFTNGDFDAGDSYDGGDGVDQFWTDGVLVDADLTNVTNVETLGGQNGGAAENFTLGAEAVETGITSVVLAGSTDDRVDASAFSRGLTVDTGFQGAGGNDVVITGSGADTVLLNSGVNNVTLNGGNDTVIAQGSELRTDDVINGGAGTDTILLDVRGVGNTAIDADVNLSNVTNVENYAFLGNGITDNPATAANENAAQVNTLTFTGGSVTSVTPINIDTSAVTDVNDTNVIEINTPDNDYTFNITGGASRTVVNKLNVGVDNNINFTGGSGVDVLAIDGDDAGSTVDFDGNGGRDIIAVTGGDLEDDAFIDIEDVEIVQLTDDTDSVTVGSRAAQAGIDTIVGTDTDDDITVGQGFDNDLTIVTGEGNDFINASEAEGDIIVDFETASQLDGDTVQGGEGNTTITFDFEGGAMADLSNIVNVDNIVITTDNTATSAGSSGTVFVDGSALDVADFDGPLSVTASGLSANESLAFGGQGSNLAFNVTGSNNADTIVGGAGADTLLGGGGNDYIDGNNGNDVINGGAGNDVIRGGNGADQLTGGVGSDIFYYDDQGQSFGATSRDTITDLGATDQIFIDLDGDGEADDIEFVGNVNGFAEVESSITGGDGVIEAIYDTSSNILYIDVDDDGDISGADIQILLNGVAAFNAANLAGPGDFVPASAGAPGSDDDGNPELLAMAPEGLDVMVSPFDMGSLGSELG